MSNEFWVKRDGDTFEFHYIEDMRISAYGQIEAVALAKLKGMGHLCEVRGINRARDMTRPGAQTHWIIHARLTDRVHGDVLGGAR